MRTFCYKFLLCAGFAFALTSVLMVGAGSAAAQSTTEGSIAGTIFDPSGASVNGAAVTIHNVGTNADIRLASDSSGFFKAPLVEPGTYTVKIVDPGFAEYRADAVVVLVGQVTTLEPHLSVATASSSVVVTEQTPSLNLESPDFNSTIDTRTISALPINNRR